jgi:hypothetical protein
VAELEQLYAQLPPLTCRGLCEDSCAQLVDAGPLERRRIAQRGVDLDAPTADGACPALSHALGGALCSVYEARPVACRLWGVAASMPCPHGCLPEGGRVSDDTMLCWMLESLELGGRPNPALRQLLERCLADAHTTALMGRMLRGDRSVAAELAAQLTASESTTGQSTVEGLGEVAGHFEHSLGEATSCSHRQSHGQMPRSPDEPRMRPDHSLREPQPVARQNRSFGGAACCSCGNLAQ